VTLLVRAPGPSATVQDLGRPGRAGDGVGPSGAADRGALRLANRLVGNAEQAAGLEVVLGGLRLTTDRPAVLAVTGAPCPVTVDGHPRGHRAALALQPGEELRLGTAPAGLRAVVAVRGGITVPPVLGSRSTDVLAGLGPPPLTAGTRLPVGPAPVAPPYGEVAAGPDPTAGTLALQVVLGPRDDWFTPAAVASLLAQTWTVSADADRVGLRLTGTPLERARTGELPSEGLVRGALQVPPSGLPTLVLADHPLTGGYPVVAVLREDDADRAAQARPGQALRLRPAGSAPLR